MTYTYKDFVTGKIKRTRGTFDGWTQPTGLLKAPYAKFKNRKSTLLVPDYLLSKGTIKRIGQPPQPAVAKAIGLEDTTP